MEKYFLRVDEVMQILGVSKSYAYKVIRKLNSELQQQRLSYDCRQSQQTIFLEKYNIKATKGECEMAIYKDGDKWRAVYRFTDWTGERKQTQKRGFKTKREAQAWEREQLNKAKADIDMTFESFIELYRTDLGARIKENTWETKDSIIDKS